MGCCCCGASLNGSTANGVLSYGSSTVADVEANLTFNGSVLDLRSSNSGSANGLLIYNSNTAANSAAQIRLIVEDTNNAGTDAEIIFETGSNKWRIGTDNSDADAWVITRAGTLGDRASQRVRIDDLVFRIHAEEAVSSPYGALAITSRDDLSGANGNFGIVFQQMTSSDTLSSTRGRLFFNNQTNNMEMYFDAARTSSSGRAFNINCGDSGISFVSHTNFSVESGGDTGITIGHPNGDWGRLDFGDDTHNYQYSVLQNAGNFYIAYRGTTKMHVASDGTITGDFNDTSDERIKENIEDSTIGLAEILQLRPVKFNFKEGQGSGELGQKFYGLIAQEVETIIPEAVHTADVSRSTTTSAGDVITPIADMKSINNKQLTSALIKAVQELNAKIDALGS